jgi:hypothetical protein
MTIVLISSPGVMWGKFGHETKGDPVDKATYDVIQEMFKPVVIILITIIGFFIKSEFNDIKTSIGDIFNKLNEIPKTYVEQADCDKYIKSCVETRKEHRELCSKNMSALQEVTSSLVTCVNRHVDSCDVKNKL